ncbi:MAG: DUF2314 domain-containing protein [Cytophagales bacterium]|nr:DUF2314 domain-containing protein [Cytophagales bacterium]
MTKRISYIIGIFFLLSSCSTKETSFDRKDDEPIFANINSDDSEYLMTVKEAQSQINSFIEKLKTKPESSNACVKIPVSDNKGKTAFTWLVNPVFDLDSCVAEIFEIPSEFDLKQGDKLKFIKNDIQDWYILDQEGRMEGGYSLRYMRKRLSIKDQMEFDKYIGVKVYL